MSSTMTQPSLPTPLRVSDVTAKMAKASIRKADTKALYRSLGGAMEEVMRAFGLTLKEFAFQVGKDERQIARQIDGTDRPQIEAVFAVERFRGAMVIALARLAADVDVVTEIRVRRSA
jgi:hypothetical protein